MLAQAEQADMLAQAEQRVLPLDPNEPGAHYQRQRRNHRSSSNRLWNKKHRPGER